MRCFEDLYGNGGESYDLKQKFFDAASRKKKYIRIWN